MPKRHHQNKHNRGSTRSSFPAATDQNPFEALAGVPQGDNYPARSSPKGSKSALPVRGERIPSIPTAASSVYSRTSSGASGSIFSKDARRKSSSASSINTPSDNRNYSLASLPASNKSDTSLTPSAVDDFAQMPDNVLTMLGMPAKHGNQIQNRKLQIAEKARTRAEAKAQQKKPAHRGASRESLPGRPSPYRGNSSRRSSTPLGTIPSGLSSRTISGTSRASFGTSYDSFGNERRLSDVSDATSCEDGSVVSEGSAHLEIDPWGENVTETYRESTHLLNSNAKLTKTGFLQMRSGKNKNPKPQFIRTSSGAVRTRSLPSDDGASSSSSEEITATPDHTTHSARYRTTKAIPKEFHYKSGDRMRNDMTNELLKKEYGAKRGGETSRRYSHLRHTNDDDLESLGLRLFG